MSSIAPHPRPPPSPRAPGVAAPRRSPRPASWRQRPTGRGAALRPPGGACGPLRSAGPCASSGARVPAVAEMMPARRTLAAGSFAVRASLLCRQRLRPVLRRRPRPEAPCGLAGSEPGKRVPGGRRRGDETAESASEHRASRRCAPVPGEKRGGRRVPGEVAAEGSPASSTGDRAAQELRQQLTRKQWRNRQKNKRRQNNKFKASDRRLLASSVTDSPQDDQGGLTLDTEVPGRQALSLRQRLESRLDAARFRYINQLLYTRSSREAAQLFQEDPEALAVYHRGFALQAARWPERPTSLPSCGRLWLRGLHPGSQLAQPGTLLRPGGPGPAGDRLRHGTGRPAGPAPHAPSGLLAPPDSCSCRPQVPLEDASVDVVVFCLALMGTNLREILQEAYRVLRLGGTLLVAEVASRFADLRTFLGALARLGFRLISKDVSSNYFYTFELRKSYRAEVTKAAEEPRGLALRPCLYKRR
ncbi:ribosomal RNA-processing protein 8 isoform X2 [Ahaetulla prasina]|uniref:ribosomal RNA-processing protein 8 isoform X2 n=1 Tax=Ahaetulla prasina TaxID=499056 RepID=UPI002648846D|nr:ribosomal RNA-processing protein 8 isoform X2 [Ahaetulla prasina]